MKLCLLYFICQINFYSIKKTAWLMSHAELLKRFSLPEDAVASASLLVQDVQVLHEMLTLHQLTQELLIGQIMHCILHCIIMLK